MKSKVISVYQWQMILFFYFGCLFTLLLVTGIVIFLVVRFLILDTDYSAIPLILAFIAMPIALAIYARKHQAFSRFFLRYRFDENGIDSYGLGWKFRRIQWIEIRSYAITGIENPGPYCGFLCLSTELNRTYNEDLHMITPDKILLQSDYEMWKTVRAFFPDDIRKEIEYCFNSKKDGYFKRKKQDRGRFSVLR